MALCDRVRETPRPHAAKAVVALAGIMVGLATACAGSRLIESLLYDVSSRDPRPRSPAFH